MTDLYALPGWTGEEIPLEAQMLVLMRKYAAACQLVFTNAKLLHEDVEKLIKAVGDDPTNLPGALSSHPFFIRVASKFQDSHQLFGDSGLRKSCGELFDEARDELEDMIAWTAMGLWVMDGAEFPEGLLDMYRENELDDEEE